MECFMLLSEQRRKLCVAFNSVIKRIFKLSRYISLHDLIAYIGSKPCDIFLDERRSLLLMSYLKSIYNVVKICGHLLIDLAEFRRISMKYDTDLVLPVGLIRQKIHDNAYVSQL